MTRSTAIAKPKHISSAQVIRDLQKSFNPSKYFAPWLKAERERMRKNHVKEKRIKNLQVKLGHGGTLDPMAAGILIIGVGSGTKELSRFLQCTKTYETTVLFGVATDSYDSQGKILAKAPFSHVTRTRVEEALGKFRGKILQRPPIFSALKMQGKKLYEYARAGQELPNEIAERSMTVSSIALLEWFPGSSHDYSVPKDEAESGKKAFAESVMQVPASAERLVKEDEAEEKFTVLGKRKASEDEDPVTAIPSVNETRKHEPQTLISSALQESLEDDRLTSRAEGATSSPELNAAQVETAPAAKIRMTVSSGFYVRSFCNDLGRAVGSLAHMVQLSRTKQGDFEIGRNVLEYSDFTSKEEVWAPQIEAQLSAWQSKHSMSLDGVP